MYCHQRKARPDWQIVRHSITRFRRSEYIPMNYYVHATERCHRGFTSVKARPSQSTDPLFAISHSYRTETAQQPLSGSDRVVLAIEQRSRDAAAAAKEKGPLHANSDCRIHTRQPDEADETDTAVHRALAVAQPSPACLDMHACTPPALLNLDCDRNNIQTDPINADLTRVSRAQAA